MNQILLIITTAPHLLLAEQIAKLLIKRDLAACVSIKEIKSIYKWQGTIEENKEFELTIKTLPENLDELIQTIKRETTYKLPQLISKIFDSENSYFQWIKESTK